MLDIREIANWMVAEKSGSRMITHGFSEWSAYFFIRMTPIGPKLSAREYSILHVETIEID